VLGGLMAVGVLGLALSLLSLGGDRRTDLERRLGGYGHDEESDATPTHDDSAGAETRIVQDMAAFTGRLAERVGLLNRVEHKLEQADLPLRPPEALFFYLVSLGIVLVGSLLVLPLAAAPVLTVIAAFGPVVFLEVRRKKRLRRFETQLPDVLNLLAGSMRAGFSFAQGLEAVANEASEPTRRELQRAFAEGRLGRPLEDALEDSANRMQSIDLLWAVMAIRIQREVGGNLAELLDTVGRTMTQRERLRREILSLTAEARMSAWILGVFPPAFGVVLYVIKPDYMSTLFQNTMGIMAVVAAAVLASIGFVWLRRIMKIEV
jgi:tight adherence protein B